MIGIIGGMGVYAGTDLVDKISASTRAASDQDHLPVVLLSDPNIPDRSAYVLSDAPSVGNPGAIVNGHIDKLVQMGCTVCAIACNTFHIEAIYAEVRDRSDVQVLSIVDETIRVLRENREEVGSVAVLGTEGTIKLGLYHRALEDSRLPYVNLSDSCISDVSKAIRNVPQGLKHQALNPTDYAVDLMIRAIDEAVELGAQTVLLACTELPLILRSQRARNEFKARPISVIDPSTQLARSLIQSFAPEKLRPAQWNANILAA